MSARTRIVLADDHALVRAGVAGLIANCDAFEIVAEVASGEALVDYLADHVADIALMDLHMPGQGGVRTMQILAERDIATRVIVLTSQDKGPYAAQLLELGAAGYVTKGGDAQTLLRALQRVAAGGSFLEPTIAHRLYGNALDGDGGSPFDRLSPREMDIAQRLMDGEGQKSISYELDISAKTVATHKANLMVKLDIDSVAQMIKLAMHHGLIE